MLDSRKSYAFGMEMPGRKWAASNYRYSYNGQEKEQELFAGANSAEYWMYDSRIGRRWNIDPVVNETISPYACFNNNPIFFSDVNGDWPGRDKFTKRKYTDGTFWQNVGRLAGQAGRGLSVAAKVAQKIKLEAPQTMGPFKGQPESELHRPPIQTTTSEGAEIVNAKDYPNIRGLYYYNREILQMNVGVGVKALGINYDLNSGELGIGLSHNKSGFGIGASYDPQTMTGGVSAGYELRRSQESKYKYQTYVKSNKDFDLLIYGRNTKVQFFAMINNVNTTINIKSSSLGMDGKYYPTTSIYASNSNTVFLQTEERMKMYLFYTHAITSITGYTVYGLIGGGTITTQRVSLHDSINRGGRLGGTIGSLSFETRF